MKTRPLRSRWKIVFDMVIGVFAFCWIYLLLSATHYRHYAVTQYAMYWLNWKTRFVVYLMLPAGLAIAWTITRFFVYFPSITNKIPRRGSFQYFILVIVLAIIFYNLFVFGVCVFGD